jgi:hypothetical protein
VVNPHWQAVVEARRKTEGMPEYFEVLQRRAGGKPALGAI